MTDRSRHNQKLIVEHERMMPTIQLKVWYVHCTRTGMKNMRVWRIFKWVECPRSRDNETIRPTFRHCLRGGIYDYQGVRVVKTTFPSCQVSLLVITVRATSIRRVPDATWARWVGNRR
jgi:hypothetical protein